MTEDLIAVLQLRARLASLWPIGVQGFWEFRIWSCLRSLNPAIFFVVLYCTFRSLPFLGLLGFSIRQLKV